MNHSNDTCPTPLPSLLIRGGTFPMAYVYPAEMRATRDLLRRRNHLTRKRAELLAHIKNTNSQYNLEPLTVNVSFKKNRSQALETFTDLDVRISVEADLELIAQLEKTRSKMELHITRNAKSHNPQALYRLRNIPGIGEILSLVILYEIGDISRFPRVQDFASYARLVKCARESGGKKSGTSGRKIGNAEKVKHFRSLPTRWAGLFISS